MATSAAAAERAAPPCQDTTIPLTVEESRLTKTLGDNPEPVPSQILRRSGFDHPVRAFERSLCSITSLRETRSFVFSYGKNLWKRIPAGPKDDDRPLYWARLASTKALRQWTPGFAVSPGERKQLERDLEYSSRGITTAKFLPVKGVRKVFVTGFDPFLLDAEIRRGNPSGASVHGLDGTFVKVDGKLAQIETVILPVRYADFNEHIAEDALKPHLANGSQQADLVTTISQGRPEQFDLEVFNGRRRSTSSVGDNNNIWGGGTATAPVVAPEMGLGQEFLRTSLPTTEMGAVVGRWRIRVNTEVTEIPATGGGPVVRPDGPTAGSIAVNGSGGGYLSNEVAYRGTRLRDELGIRRPVGHLHTPVLLMAPDNTSQITDPIFERNRTDIATQVGQILRAGIATL